MSVVGVCMVYRACMVYICGSAGLAPSVFFPSHPWPVPQAALKNPKPCPQVALNMEGNGEDDADTSHSGAGPGSGAGACTAARAAGLPSPTSSASAPPTSLPRSLSARLEVARLAGRVVHAASADGLQLGDADRWSFTRLAAILLQLACIDFQQG